MTFFIMLLVKKNKVSNGYERDDEMKKEETAPRYISDKKEDNLDWGRIQARRKAFPGKSNYDLSNIGSILKK